MKKILWTILALVSYAESRYECRHGNKGKDGIVIRISQKDFPSYYLYADEDRWAALKELDVESVYADPSIGLRLVCCDPSGLYVCLESLRYPGYYLHLRYLNPFLYSLDWFEFRAAFINYDGNLPNSFKFQFREVYKHKELSPGVHGTGIYNIYNLNTPKAEVKSKFGYVSAAYSKSHQIQFQATWVVLVTEPKDNWVTIAVRENYLSTDLTYKCDTTYGLTNLKSQRLKTDNRLSVSGEIIKAMEFDYRVSGAWENTQTQTWKVSIKESIQLTIPPKTSIELQQLVGIYGDYTISSNFIRLLMNSTIYNKKTESIFSLSQYN